MTPSAPVALDYEELPFEIVEEVWNEYELQDDTILKARILMLKILKHKEQPLPKRPKELQFSFQTQNHVVAYSPATKRGQPSPPISGKEMAKADKYKVKALSTNEPWNIYRIVRTGATVKVKLVLNEVFRVKDKYGPDGSPMYFITSAPLIQYESPSKSAPTP